MAINNIIKKKPLHYYCPVFRENFYIFKGFSAEEFSNYLDNRMGFSADIGQALGKAYHLVSREKNELFLIWAKNDSPSIWVHECVHASNLLFKKKGVSLDTSNDELQAYYIQCLMRVIFGE